MCRIIHQMQREDLELLWRIPQVQKQVLCPEKNPKWLLSDAPTHLETALVLDTHRKQEIRKTVIKWMLAAIPDILPEPNRATPFIAVQLFDASLVGLPSDVTFQAQKLKEIAAASVSIAMKQVEVKLVSLRSILSCVQSDNNTPAEKKITQKGVVQAELDVLEYNRYSIARVTPLTCIFAIVNEILLFYSRDNDTSGSDETTLHDLRDHLERIADKASQLCLRALSDSRILAFNQLTIAESSFAVAVESVPDAHIRSLVTDALAAFLDESSPAFNMYRSEFAITSCSVIIRSST